MSAPPTSEKNALLPLARLHPAHAATRLDGWSAARPALERGTIWSTVVATPPQYPQVYRSRAKISSRRRLHFLVLPVFLNRLNV